MLRRLFLYLKILLFIGLNSKVNKADENVWTLLSPLCSKSVVVPASCGVQGWLLVDG